MATGYVMRAQAGFVDASDVEREDLDVLEATLTWGDDVLATKHFPLGARISLGDEGCDFAVPTASLGTERVVVTGGDHVTAPPWATVTGPTELRRGHATSVVLKDFTLTLKVVAAGRKVDTGFLAALRDLSLGTVGGSAAMHIGILASLFAFMPALSADDSEAIDRDRIYAMKTLLDNAAEREREQDPPTPEAGGTANDSDHASGGGRAQGAEGASGRTDPKTTAGRWSIKGNARPEDAAFQRERDKEAAQTFGMLGLLASSQLTDPDAPVAAWGRDVAVGSDKESHAGDMWSVNIGDAFGTGLGLSGPGEGGGGTAEGVGINDIGGLGRSLDTRLGHGSCDGKGPCDGIGNSHGHFMGNYHPHTPSVRPDPHTEVNGHLAPEIIQRIVRQNQGRFRNCYETGLRTNPSLGGRVAVKFVIDRQGAVSMASDGGSDLPDQGVTKCVVQSFYNLSFPAPQDGTVRVTYPIMLTPGD